MNFYQSCPSPELVEGRRGVGVSSQNKYYETNKHSFMFVRNEWMGFSRTFLANKSGL